MEVDVQRQRDHQRPANPWDQHRPGPATALSAAQAPGQRGRRDGEAQPKGEAAQRKPVPAPRRNRGGDAAD